MDLEKQPFNEQSPDQHESEGRPSFQTEERRTERDSYYEERPRQRQSFSDQPYLPTQVDIHGLGIASLICGICSLLFPFLNVILAIIAIVLGNRVKKEAERLDYLDGRTTDGRTMGKVGFWLGMSSLIITAIIICFWMVAIGLAIAGNM